MKFVFAFLIVSISILSGTQNAVTAEEPIVIAHRGASGYLPEHTLEAYALAIEQGADYIEPDLVLTKDGYLVARHDAYLSSTTNVADLPEFASKKRMFMGKEDWFVFDFTLDELKRLRARQPRVSRGTEFDNTAEIPTIEEIIELVEGYKEKGSDVGLYIEMKRPTAFMKIAPNLDKKLINLFGEISIKNIPVYFQCFDGNFLFKISEQSSVPLVLLIGGKMDDASGAIKLGVDIEHYTGRIAGVGLNKALLFNTDGTVSDVLAKVRKLGMKAHIWTVRNDEVPSMFNNVEQELKKLYSMGVDGIFTDFPDTAISIRNSLMLLEGPELND